METDLFWIFEDEPPRLAAVLDDDDPERPVEDPTPVTHFQD